MGRQQGGMAAAVGLQAGRHGGMDKARPHRIDAYVVGTVLQRGSLCQANDTVLGGGIGGTVGKAHHAQHGGGIDDGTSAVFSMAAIWYFMP